MYLYVSVARRAHLPLHAEHGGGLPDVAHVHGDLGAAAERLGVEQENDGRLELTADGRVHPGADHHHALKHHRHITTTSPPSHHYDITTVTSL